jgi:hypothetical protein
MASPLTAGDYAKKRLWAPSKQDKQTAPIYTALVRERRYNPLAQR